MNTPAIEPAMIERVLLHGDLRQLSPAQKVSYYKAVCDSVGLNPLTQPFQYLILNGKEILYARREATEQLRQIHSVSIHITAREVVEECYVVTAQASLPTGRTDENIGVVPIAGLKGEARANALMKAETKAKRRVTLAICGLGMLDETEVATIPGAQPVSIAQFVEEVPKAAPAPVRAPERPVAPPVAHSEPSVLDTELPPPPVISEAQGKRLYAISKSAGWTVDGLKAWLLPQGILSIKAITKAQYNAVIAAIEKGPPSQPVQAAEIFGGDDASF